MIESKLSIIFLISNASVPVQIVIAILGFISVSSWAIIFGKTINFRRVKKSTNDFERDFWSGGELLDLLNKIESGKISGSMANIFEGGMREFIKSRKESNLSQAAIMDNTRRALKAASFK